MIELKNCSKEYTGSLALNSINLSFAGSGLVLVLGANAAGKSTLLKTIAGLVVVSQGEIDSSVSTAYFGHESGLYPELTVAENLMMLESLQIINRSSLEKFKDIFELKPLLKKSFSDLSQGQKARVNLTRVFSSPDKWPILLDEPASNLDSRWSDRLLEMVKAEASQRLILLVTHDPKKYYQTAARVIFMDHGKVIADFENDAEHKVEALYREYLR